MKTTIIPLIGDPKESLYQLGLKERDSFLNLEDRITKLLSSNSVLRYGQDIISRARALMKSKDPTGFFDDCIKAYAEGLGIDASRYHSFLNLLEVAAHYGQVYPELKSIIPGCTSVFQKGPEGFTHARLIDFPLMGVFDKNPRLYYWKVPGKAVLLNYSCEGLAPLMLQNIHESGFSLALHHKPGSSYHREGESIFKIIFETLFETSGFKEFRKDVRKRNSITKWGFLLLNKDGKVHTIDLDGPAVNTETYDLNETGPLIFTNIPIQKDPSGFESFLSLCASRQTWTKEKLSKHSTLHLLDQLTDVEDQKLKRWHHPAATLSTVGAIHVNLSTGVIALKEGSGALISKDATTAFSLSDYTKMWTLKEAEPLNDFESAWKKASLAQSYFDQEEWDLAYHHLQMALAIMPSPMWKEVFTFYLCVWDFRFIGNSQELSHVYRRLKKIKAPEVIKDQWLLMCMRLEKKLGLSPTVALAEVSPHLRELFTKEKDASKVTFAAWMKLLYPRMELLDVISPYNTTKD